MLRVRRSRALSHLIGRDLITIPPNEVVAAESLGRSGKDRTVRRAVACASVGGFGAPSGPKWTAEVCCPQGASPLPPAGGQGDERGVGGNPRKARSALSRTPTIRRVSRRLRINQSMRSANQPNAWITLEKQMGKVARDHVVLRGGARQAEPGHEPPRGTDPIPTREPIHDVDRQYARLQRRLGLGGFAILIGLVVLFAAVQYGGVAAAIGAIIILGGGLLLAVLWFLLTALEWWANRPTD